MTTAFDMIIVGSGPAGNSERTIYGQKTGVVNMAEKLLWPLDRWLALHHVIIIRKASI